MNALIKTGITFGSIAGASGLGYAIYYNITKSQTYSEILKDALLSTSGDNNKTEWTARLTSLQAVQKDSDLVDNLKKLKNKKVGEIWKELRDWCAEILNNAVKEEKKKEFQNIQSYCTFSVKEKIGTAIDERKDDNSDEWKLGHDILMTITDENELDEELKKNKKKSDDTEKKAIRAWCITNYKKPFKGETDKDFKNASRICKSKT